MEREHESDRQPAREVDRHQSWGLGSPGGRGDERRGSHGEFGQRQQERVREREQEWTTGGWGFGTGPGSVYRSDDRSSERARPCGSGSARSDQWDALDHDESRTEWWNRGQTFAGRGPQGYRRSDGRIQEDICDRLTDDPRVDAREVTVRVENGEVTLEGTVNSRQEKRDAENLCERIAGVQDVHNHLRVAAPGAARSRQSGAPDEDNDLGTGPHGTTGGSRA